MDAPQRSSGGPRFAPVAAAAIAAVAAVGILYKAKLPAAPVEPQAVVEAAPQAVAAPAAPVQPPSVAAPITQPAVNAQAQNQSSPLPFAGQDLRATKTAAPLELTVSAFEPERGVSQEPDHLAPAQGTETKPVPQPHLRPMPNMSGYLTEKHQTQAFFGAPQQAPAGQAQAQAMVNNQLAMMIAQLGRAMANAKAPGPQSGLNVPPIQARSRSAGAAGSQPAVAAAPMTRTMIAPAAVGNTGELAALVGQQAAQIAYPAGRAMTIYVAPWCPYCQRGVAQYQGLYRSLSARGYDVRILVMGDTQDRMDAFARAIGPGASVSNDRAANPLHGYPALVVSRDGRATAAHLGDFDSVDQGAAWALAH